MDILTVFPKPHPVEKKNSEPSFPPKLFYVCEWWNGCAGVCRCVHMHGCALRGGKGDM